MFRNKKAIPESWADAKMRELYNEWSKALDVLWEKAKQTYIKAEALKVYDPTTPDGKDARKCLETAKYDLRCSIGRYDSAVAEIKQHYAAHHEQMQKCWHVEFRTSHQQIEFAIAEVLRGR